VNFFLWSEASRDRHELTMKQEPFQPFLFHSFLKFSQASVVLDIGANVGVYSLLSVLQPSVKRIYAFEPDHEAYKELLINVRLNAVSDVVEVSNYAVSDSEGELRFGLHAPMAGVNAVLDTSIHDVAVFKEFSQVRCTAIDLMGELKGQTLGLKIDVEGHELNVINGARQTLINTPSFLQIEHYAGDDIDHVLSDMGYFRFFASGHDHYFTNIRNFANPEFVKRAVEYAGTCLVESQSGRWPEGKTVKDGLSISYELENGKILVSVVKDDRFFGDDAEYAFYLLENGKKVEEKWYTPMQYAEFPFNKQAETIEVKGFVRESSFPDKKVAVGVYIKNSAVGFRAKSAVGDAVGSPSQYATLASYITGGQLGYPDLDVSKVLGLLDGHMVSDMIQLGGGEWALDSLLGCFKDRPITVLLPLRQENRMRSLKNLNASISSETFSPAKLHYVKTPEQTLDFVTKFVREASGSICVVLRDQFLFDIGEDSSFLNHVLKLLPKGSKLYAEGLVNARHRQYVSNLVDTYEMSIDWLYPKSLILIPNNESLREDSRECLDRVGLVSSYEHKKRSEPELWLDFSLPEEKCRG